MMSRNGHDALPVFGTYDVVVCGGGPAGIGAAVSAAQQGARTLLIEHLAQLGGMHTGAGVVAWCESGGGPVYDEMLRRMVALDAVRFGYNAERQVAPGRPALDTEFSKLVALEMLHEAGVEVLFLTHVEGAWLDGEQVRGVVVVNKSGRGRVEAHTVVDATADADVAHSAGAALVKGDPADGRLQHCNYRAWWDGIDRERAEAEKLPDAELIAMLQRAQAEGRLTPPDNLFQPARETFPFNERFGKLALTSWELENVDPTDAGQVSRLLVQCQVATLQMVRLFREKLPGYEKACVRKLPSLLGMRESRRLVGQYVLTEDDVRAGRKFDDGIARAWFYMDLHDSPPGTTFPHATEHLWANRPPRDDWYEIPYRCLLPERVRGLLVAGRCISTDRMAHGSARVMATCMFTGSAAGVAAGMAALRGLAVDQIDGRAVRSVVIPDEQQSTPRCMAEAAVALGQAQPAES